MSETSPRPWKMPPENGKGEHIVSIRDALDQFVAEVALKRDAALIVRAVNAMPQMIEALERCLTLLDMMPVANVARGHGLVLARDHARAALAAAKGEER